MTKSTEAVATAKKDVKKGPIVGSVQHTLENWVPKDRTYILNTFRPWFKLRSKGVKVWDEGIGESRLMKYTTNQRTPFVDEFKGKGAAAHIIFERGWLHVPKDDKVLQLFMHLSEDNVANGGTWYREDVPEDNAAKEVASIEVEAEALSIALGLDIDAQEAIVREIVGREATTMKNAELKRELLIFAKEDPEGFLALNADEELPYRNIVYKSVDLGILEVKDKGRSLVFKSNGKLLLTIPFGEDLYDYTAHWFTGDEGTEALNAIVKLLK